MKLKVNAKNASIITRDLREISAVSGNTYGSIVIIAKRAKQLAMKNKEELNLKLADFASSVDNLEEIHENKEQIEISKYYERMPKATVVATDSFLNDELSFRHREVEED